MRIVIIGNGVAGIEAALAVRAERSDWPITIISEESDHFFSRTALMYVLAGQLAYRDLEPYERDLYARKRFERVRARASQIDSAAKRIEIAGGPPIAYDRLLIACGSRPRPAPWPGSDLIGIGHFVTLQDLDWLERELHGGPATKQPPHPENGAPPASPYRARPSRREQTKERTLNPVVIGGGLIGIEVVETMVAAGLAPLFLLRDEWFWPISIDRREAEWVAAALRTHRVDVRLGSKVVRFLGDERRLLRGIDVDGQALPCDLAVAAIGVVPNTEWLASTPIELDQGAIVVDAGLATTLPEVFAAGDCAAVRWFDGSRKPEQLWYTARDQGRIAGRRLLGEAAEYRRGVWYNSAKLMDIEYTTAGRFPASGEEWFFEERGPVKSTLRIASEGGAVVGFNALGRRWNQAPICRWIEERRPLDFFLEHLEDARFDSELVPPLVIPPPPRS